MEIFLLYVLPYAIGFVLFIVPFSISLYRKQSSCNQVLGYSFLSALVFSFWPLAGIVIWLVTIVCALSDTLLEGDMNEKPKVVLEVADEIIKLKKLADTGVITDSEFETKKQQLLST